MSVAPIEPTPTLPLGMGEMIVSPGHDARCYLHGDEADPERVERN